MNLLLGDSYYYANRIVTKVHPVLLVPEFMINLYVDVFRLEVSPGILHAQHVPETPMDLIIMDVETNQIDERLEYWKHIAGNFEVTVP